MSQLLQEVEAASKAGKLLPASVENIAAVLQGGRALYENSVVELVAGEHWEELNDRFYTRLAFGTGGLRGRTIGKIVTEAERGEPQAARPPAIPVCGH